MIVEDFAYLYENIIVFSYNHVRCSEEDQLKRRNVGIILKMVGFFSSLFLIMKNFKNFGSVRTRVEKNESVVNNGNNKIGKLGVIKISLVNVPIESLTPLDISHILVVSGVL